MWCKYAIRSTKAPQSPTGKYFMSPAWNPLASVRSCCSSCSIAAMKQAFWTLALRIISPQQNAVQTESVQLPSKIAQMLWTVRTQQMLEHCSLRTTNRNIVKHSARPNNVYISLYVYGEKWGEGGKRRSPPKATLLGRLPNIPTMRPGNTHTHTSQIQVMPPVIKWNKQKRI